MELEPISLNEAYLILSVTESGDIPVSQPQGHISTLRIQFCARGTWVH